MNATELKTKYATELLAYVANGSRAATLGTEPPAAPVKPEFPVEAPPPPKGRFGQAWALVQPTLATAQNKLQTVALRFSTTLVVGADANLAAEYNKYAVALHAAHACMADVEKETLAQGGTPDPRAFADVQAQAETHLNILKEHAYATLKRTQATAAELAAATHEAKVASLKQQAGWVEPKVEQPAQ